MPADTYTPGAGARTLEPVAGMAMLGAGGGRYRVLIARDGVAFAVFPAGYDREVPSTPDLTDEATYLLALSALARRLRCGLLLMDDGSWGLSPLDSEARPLAVPQGVEWVRGLVVSHRAWGADPREALDRALWATREVPRG